MLEAERLTVRYGALVALDAVDLRVERGSIHGVIGPNGAGKSTLMDAICGRARPRHGRVRLDGVDVTGRSVAARRRLGMARSFQRTSIFPGLTVIDQLRLVGRRVGEQRLDEVVAALGLTDLAGRRADTIAYGDQRRVDIALGLLGDAKVLLLDEPAAGLSVEETRELFEHVARLVRDRGVTAVIVEHDVDAVFRTCDVVTVLDLGRVLVTGPPDAVRADPRVVTAYLGTSA